MNQHIPVAVEHEQAPRRLAPRRVASLIAASLLALLHHPSYQAFPASPIQDHQATPAQDLADTKIAELETRLRAAGAQAPTTEAFSWNPADWFTGPSPPPQ